MQSWIDFLAKIRAFERARPFPPAVVPPSNVGMLSISGQEVAKKENLTSHSEAIVNYKHLTSNRLNMARPRGFEPLTF
jgi:hypothetical protein